MVDIDDDIEKLYLELARVKDSNSRLWILGNGGSLAIAQHFAQDLLKVVGIRAHAINCPSIITAYSNDDGFEKSYSNPIDKLIEKGDQIFIFSCSGKSRNYQEFIADNVSTRKNSVLSVVGTDGGFLKENSNTCVHVKSLDYQVCETAFCFIADILIKSLLEV